MTGLFKYWICGLILFSELLLAAPKCREIVAPKNPNIIANRPVQFENKDYPYLVYDNFKYNEGAFYIRPAGDRAENLKKTKKYIILLHGVGADFSNPDSMLHQYGNYTGTTAFEGSNPGKASYGKTQVTKNQSYQEGAYVEILPLPGSTYGGLSRASLGKSVDKALLMPLKKHIEEARRLLPEDAEIIIHGRSYGATTAAALSKKFPGLIDKLVLVGLAAPRADIVKEVFEEIRKEEKLGLEGKGPRFDQDWEWTNWFTSILQQVNWWEVSKQKNLAFGGAKTLIMIGMKDNQISEKEAIIYADFDLKFENVDFRVIPGIGHDASKTKQDSNAKARMGTLGTIYSFRHIFDE